MNSTMRDDNISMLRDTLDILEKGFYQLRGKTIPLKLSRAQMEEPSREHSAVCCQQPVSRSACSSL